MGKFLKKYVCFLALAVAPFSAAIAQEQIQITPTNPRVGQQVTFKAVNFNPTACILWKFGDGDLDEDAVDPYTTTHVYNTPGTFPVSAYYGCDPLTVPIVTTVTVLPALNQYISFDPVNPNINEPVMFTAHNYSSSLCIKWDFGDGDIVEDTSPPSIAHTYTRAGTYRVTTYDGCDINPTNTIDVTIINRGEIGFTPANPRAGEKVIFTALLFTSNTCVRWDFGDGAVEDDPTPPSIVHTYTSPGTFQVRAFDGCGEFVTAVSNVTVQADTRIVNFMPVPAIAGREVRFSALNFSATCIRWDFGDGEILPEGGREAVHFYQREGTYKATAFDHCGDDAFPIEVTVQVLPAFGPEAPFGISFIRLRYEDGSSYLSVPKGQQPLLAFADIKFEGVGVAELQWLVDGQPFYLHSQAVGFAEQISINSVQSLPTLSPGTHDVTLQVLKPEISFNIPAIRYYIPLEGEEAAPLSAAPGLEIFIAQAYGQDGKPLQVAMGEVQAPAEEHLLLQGSVINNRGGVLAYGKLNVFLQNKQVDSQVIKELPPGSGTAFETSVYNDTDTTKEVRFVLEDATGRPLQVATLFLKPITYGLAQNPLPAGIITEFRARPRTLRDGGSDDVVLEYRVENVKEAYLYVQWSYEQKGFFGPYMVKKSAFFKTLDPRKDQGRLLRPLPEIQQEGHDVTQGRTPWNYVYGMQGKYYNPATGKNEDFLIYDVLHRYTTIPDYEPTVLVKGWEFAQTDKIQTEQNGMTYAAYNNVEPISMILNVTLENPVRYPRPSFPVCQDIGVFDVSIGGLPEGCRAEGITVYGLEGCSTQTISWNLTFPPGLLKAGETSKEFTIEGRADWKNHYPPTRPGEDKKRSYSAKVFLYLPRLQGAQFSEPVIDNFSADVRTLFVGGSSRLSWSVNHLNGGGIAEADYVGAPPKDTVVTLDVKDNHAGGSLTVTPQKTTTYVLVASGDAVDPVTHATKQVFRYLTVSCVPKGTFGGEKPLIQSFKADRTTIQANEAVKLSYEFSYAGYAEIINKANGRRMELPVADPGKVIAGAIEVMPDVMSTFELVCSNPNGDDRRSLTINVRGGGVGGLADLSQNPPAPKPLEPERKYPPSIWRGLAPLIDYFQADRAVVADYEEVTFKYKFSYAETARLVCLGESSYFNIDPGEPGKVVEGTLKWAPRTTNTFQLELTNPNGKDTKTITITVTKRPFQGEPQVSKFEPSTATVEIGQPFSFSWEVFNSRTVIITGFGLGMDGLFTESTPPGQVSGKTFDYKITKPGLWEFDIAARGENQSGSVVVDDPLRFHRFVRVLDSAKPPVIRRFAPDRSSIDKGETCELAYAVSGASRADLYDGDGNHIRKIDLTYKDVGYGINNSGNPGVIITEAVGTITVAPTKAMTYRLEVGNSTTSDSETCRVEVTGLTLPKIDEFYPDKDTVNFGEPIKLVYSVKDVLNLSITDDLSGKMVWRIDEKDPNKKWDAFRHAGDAVKPDTTRWYTLRVENENGKAAKIVKIVVNGMPVAGYDIQFDRDWWWVPPFPLATCTVNYEFSGQDFARIYYLNPETGSEQLIHALNNMSGLNTKGTFQHEPEYFPARYKVVIQNLSGFQTSFNRLVR